MYQVANIPYYIPKVTTKYPMLCCNKNVIIVSYSSHETGPFSQEERKLLLLSTVAESARQRIPVCACCCWYMPYDTTILVHCSWGCTGTAAHRNNRCCFYFMQIKHQCWDHNTLWGLFHVHFFLQLPVHCLRGRSKIMKHRDAYNINPPPPLHIAGRMG